MREIKFRAWNKKKNAWDTFITEFVDYENKTISLSIPENSHLIIMQFTGLHDKNGKEIYEGDVCKVDDGDNVYEVIFYMGGFMLEVLPRKIRIYHMADRLFSNIEVIGNIYENPTL